MTDHSLSLLSLNVKELSNFKKRRTIFTWCRKRNSDIIFLQETRSTLSTQLNWKNEWGAELICSHGSSNSRGVAILIKKGLDCVIHSQIIDTSGRYIVVKVAIQDKMYVLINIYAPNKDENIVKFFKDLLTKLATENLDSEENIVIGGDFNCPLNPTLDKQGGIMTPRKSVINCINDVQTQLDLVDIWRIKNPQTKSFTWSQRSPLIFCRLDYWLISNNLHDWVKATNIIPAIRTDHSAIYLEFGNVDKEAKGPGFWKMNTSILKDEEYIDDLTKMLPVCIAEGRKELSNHRNIWDWIKYNIRAHAIKYSKTKAKKRNERGFKLEKEYTEARQAFEKNPNDLNGNNLNAAKEKLELFYDEKVNGIIIRARVCWHEHGKKSTKYFLNLEKRNHVKKHIRKLVVSGVVKTNPFDILQEQRRFYQELYKSSISDAVNCQNIVKFLENLNIPQLTEEQMLSCEGKISAEECYNILDSFQINKTPGNDGIPVEFYKVLWSIISDPFLKCVTR